MSRFTRFSLLFLVFLGGAFSLFISAVHFAQGAGIISNEHNWRSLLKDLIFADSPATAKLKVRRSIRPRAIVVLDAGHGGTDGGTVAGSSLEKDLNMKVVHLVAEQLRNERVRVVYTRQGDVTQSLRNRVAVANGYPEALFVSIHHNASTSEKPEGFETFYTHPKPSYVLKAQRNIFGVKKGGRFIDRRGELLASAIQASSCEVTQAVDRGIKNGSMALTRLVSCPAVLVECGFLSNAMERGRLKDSNYRTKLSTGISGGIIAFLESVEHESSYGVESEREVQARDGGDVTRKRKQSL